MSWKIDCLRCLVAHNHAFHDDGSINEAYQIVVPFLREEQPIE